ncbi:MAG: hypothetical protein IJ759_05175 [Bacteroidales bacterium]|nr:hypothetical protein [Bacteroidales bacterium]
MKKLEFLANEFANNVRKEIEKYHPYSPIKEPKIGDIIREYNICRKEEELAEKSLDEVMEMVIVDQNIKREYDGKQLLKFQTMGYTFYINVKDKTKILDANKNELDHPKFWLALLLISVEPNPDSIAGIKFELNYEPVVTYN